MYTRSLRTRRPTDKYRLKIHTLVTNKRQNNTRSEETGFEQFLKQASKYIKIHFKAITQFTNTYKLIKVMRNNVCVL